MRGLIVMPLLLVRGILEILLILINFNDSYAVDFCIEPREHVIYFSSDIYIYIYNGNIDVFRGNCK